MERQKEPSNEMQCNSIKHVTRLYRALNTDLNLHKNISSLRTIDLHLNVKMSVGVLLLNAVESILLNYRGKER